MSNESQAPALRVVVVIGTDTGVGKTVTTAALSRVAMDRGLKVAVVKAVQTGLSTDEATDAETISLLGGCASVDDLVRLDPPLAPDSAARSLGVDIPRVGELAARVLSSAHGLDLVLLEGTGGVAVRLDTAGGTILDLASALTDGGARVDFVVVTRLSLGTLNHTELTVDAVRRSGYTPAGLIFGEVPVSFGLAERTNLTELPRVSGLPVLAAIPAAAGRLQPERFQAECAKWFTDAGRLLQR
jgi:dethiobiotin synthetase